MLLSNCTFDRGSLSPTYTKPFDMLVRGNESGDWRREWDSDSRAPFRFCKLQKPHCRECRECQRYRRPLHAIARWLFCVSQCDGVHCRETWKPCSAAWVQIAGSQPTLSAALAT